MEVAIISSIQNLRLLRAFKFVAIYARNYFYQIKGLRVLLVHIAKMRQIYYNPQIFQIS